MFRSLAIATTAALLSGSALAHDRTTLVYVGGPVPQGHPYLVQDDGVVVVYPVPRTPLQFGLIDGRRVLLDPLTGRVVYYLHP
jgi:hypothetical protein